MTGLPAAQRVLQLGRPVDLRRTLAGLRRGAGDPTMRVAGGGIWRGSRTPEGPATLRLWLEGGRVHARTWGPGRDWLLDSVPGLVGEGDDWSGLDVSSHPQLHDVARRNPGLRLCATGLVMEALIAAALEQRVTGAEAWRAWRSLIRTRGEPAPGPADVVGRAGLDLWVMPEPAAVLAVPSWDWHRWGVDAQRYRTVRAAATVADRMEETAAFARRGERDEALRRLRVVPGVGEWTAAEVALRAWGDPDVVSVGDFHLKNRVGWALTGAPRSDDETMLRLLEPWRGQRARVVRLIELSPSTPPKYGPRFSPNDLRAI